MDSMGEDDMTFDLDGSGTFGSNDLPLPLDGTFDDDPIFTGGFDMGSSPFHTGITPAAWPTSMMDTPGRYATTRTDSSATAIMTGTKEVKPRSTQSSTSPDSSSQDSPSSSQSSGRRKRKSPTSQESNNTKVTSSSSRREGPPSLSPTYGPNKQAALGGKHVMHDSMSMPSGLTPEMAYHEQSVDNISSAMNHSNLFDFDSAGSSPGAFGNTISAGNFDTLGTTPRTIGIMQDTPRMTSLETGASKAPKFFIGSRENSPLDAMASSQHASPAALFPTESPNAMVGMTNDGTFWPAQARNPQFNFDTTAFMSPSPVVDAVSPPLGTVNSNPNKLPCQLNIKPFNNKSRVETQIPVVLTMLPLPHGVTRVHLQSHTISKPKLLAKETPRSRDTVELHATVVCTSAMQKPHMKDRALKRAAGLVETPSSRPAARRTSNGSTDGSESSDPNEPLNGGEVKICSNCVNRERKRAARKKAKKQEDEEHWSQFENERIVVFNTTEYKDWQPAPKDAGFGDSSQFPDGSMQVEVPMRIACYCRHQGEKTGFQVIFTVKDFQDRVIAQNISDSILITDDHKTQPTVGNASGPPSQDFNFGGVSGYSPEAQAASLQQHRPYHSTNDLQALRMQFQPGFGGMTSSHNDPNSMLQQAASTSVTPRNLSRPASPTFQAGSSKRRKGSSVHVQIPANLRMTQRVSSGPNTSMPTSMGNMSLGPMSAGPILGSADASFGMTPLNASQYTSNPPTPNSNTGFMSANNRSVSNDNMQTYQFYSTPHSQNPSRGPSRVPSPVMSRPNSRAPGQNVQSQVQNELSSQGLNMAFGTEAPAAQKPTIVRLNPTEGPITGNVPVDVHGTGFRPGLVLRFGDKPAMTTFWNEGALIAMLPPGNTPGPVEVTVHDPTDVHNSNSFFQPQSSRRNTQYFKYVDDQDQALWEMVGKTMFEKAYGNTDSVNARAMLNAQQTTFGYPTGGDISMNFGGMRQMQQRLAASAALQNTEEALLGLLNVIDLDDSPYAPNFDIGFKRTGTTMLALASGLGYTRLVAGLVARGATLDSRDRCGYTPLMLAAMRGHGQIVRLLARRGADPTLRNRLGATALDLAPTAEVSFQLQQTHQHVRVRSLGSTPLYRSRANSIAFLDARGFVPPSPPHSSDVSLITASDSDSEALHDDDGEMPAWTAAVAAVASRRGSQQMSRHPSRRPSATAVAEMQQMQRLIADEQAAGMLVSSLAAMSAWRDQIVAQVNSFQHSVSEMRSAMPNYIPESRMVRRFSSMMTPAAVRDSFLFSSSSAATTRAATPPPPPYEEKDPAKKSSTERDEKAGLFAAVAEATLDQACEARFGVTATATAVSSSALDTHAQSRRRAVGEGEILVDRDIEVHIGGKNSVTREQQIQLRLAHQARLKKGRSDWKVWVIWLPLLIVVVVLMTGNILPEIAGALGQLRNTAVGRIVMGVPA